MDVTVSTANMTSALCKHLHRQHVSTKLVNGDGIIENRFAMVQFLAIVSTLSIEVVFCTCAAVNWFSTLRCVVGFVILLKY